MFEIIPSPGTQDKDWTTIEQKIELVKPFVKTIHIDVIDGKFAQNTTFLDPSPFAKYTQDIFFEVHLMVDDPLSYVESFAQAGFRRFIGHVEKMPDQVEFVSRVQQIAEVGLALDGSTPLEAIEVPFEDLDTVLCMTIKAGFSGQAFQPDILPKVKKLSSRFFGPIEVDGGINEATIGEAAKSGASRFVTTSYLFSAEDPEQAFQTLTQRVGKNV